MPDSRDHKTEIVRLVPADGSIVGRRQTLEEHSEDETLSKEVKVRDLILHECQHAKGYGFSCSVPGCGRSYCEGCLSRASYCEECQITLGPCHSEKMADGRVFCPQHAPLVDWSGPVRGVLELLIALGTLGLTLYLLYRVVGW